MQQHHRGDQEARFRAARVGGSVRVGRRVVLVHLFTPGQHDLIYLKFEI